MMVRGVKKLIFSGPVDRPCFLVSSIIVGWFNQKNYFNDIGFSFPSEYRPIYRYRYTERKKDSLIDR